MVLNNTTTNQMMGKNMKRMSRQPNLPGALSGGNTHPKTSLEAIHYLQQRAGTDDKFYLTSSQASINKGTNSTKQMIPNQDLAELAEIERAERQVSRKSVRTGSAKMGQVSSQEKHSHS